MQYIKDKKHTYIKYKTITNTTIITITIFHLVEEDIYMSSGHSRYERYKIGDEFTFEYKGKMTTALVVSQEQEIIKSDALILYK